VRDKNNFFRDKPCFFSFLLVGPPFEFCLPFTNFDTCHQIRRIKLQLKKIEDKSERKISHCLLLLCFTRSFQFIPVIYK
jgi:hypothetical protein